jgi:hypothetical protein
MFSHTAARRKTHAWDNRRSFDCSLVVWIFRISRNHQFHPHCFSRGANITFAAFRERQRSKRVERWPPSDPVEAITPMTDR